MTSKIHHSGHIPDILDIPGIFWAFRATGQPDSSGIPNRAERHPRGPTWPAGDAAGAAPNPPRFPCAFRAATRLAPHTRQRRT